ncbi:MAG: hypothetical protein JJT76_14955 [Clostridiaceae bacterium]|nr:hypothetical protein [Clostridiaceae bacterium]
MKKIFIVILCLILILCLSSCKNKDGISHMGVNAEVLEIFSDEKGLLVKALDKDSVLGYKYYVNCSDMKTYFIEVIDSKPIDIMFEDFSVGDRITVNITKFEDKQDEIIYLQLKKRKE